MKKVFKSSIVLIIGIFLGYYVCNIDLLSIFKTTYKAFQVGVYTNIDTANLYKNKYNNSIVIKDNELYRVYVAILKDKNNIENMSNYLENKGIDFYLKELNINNKLLKKQIDEYESIMNNNNEVVFLELNKMIMKSFEESL